MSEGFTKEQIGRMVLDSDIAKRSIIRESVLSDVCYHVKALAAEVERLTERNEYLAKELITAMHEIKRMRYVLGERGQEETI